MVIHLDSKLEAALGELARERGVDPEVVALEALRERFLKLPEPRDEWERRLRSIATDCGVSLSDWALSSDGLYD